MFKLPGHFTDTASAYRLTASASAVEQLCYGLFGISGGETREEFGCCFFVEEVGFVQLFVCGNLNFGSVFSAGSKPRFVNGDTLFKKLN